MAQKKDKKLIIPVVIRSNKLTRLDYGEAWMWCIDCNCRLYSFDGSEDRGIKCPTKEDCEDLA